MCRRSLKVPCLLTSVADVVLPARCATLAFHMRFTSWISGKAILDLHPSCDSSCIWWIHVMIFVLVVLWMLVLQPSLLISWTQSVVPSFLWCLPTLRSVPDYFAATYIRVGIRFIQELLGQTRWVHHLYCSKSMPHLYWSLKLLDDQWKWPKIELASCVIFGRDEKQTLRKDFHQGLVLFICIIWFLDLDIWWTSLSIF